MKNCILIVLLLATCFFHIPLFAEVVEFEVIPNQQYDEIRPIWDILNLWSPSFLVDGNGDPVTWHKDTHPFVNRVILMTATGGRPDYPELEILKKDAQGNLFYDFANFDSYLNAALYNHFTPIIVLAAIPFALAPDSYHIGVFGSITDPPTNYSQWYDFVETLIAHCVEIFGLPVVKTWQWRLYTEPDNRDWWRGTKEEYFKLYDYTVAAALEVIPDITIGPGNMLGEIEDNWGLQFLDHAFAGTNYYDGKRGSYLKSFTISAYERCEKDHPPLKKFVTRVRTIKEKLQQYGALDTIAIGFDEGQLITDEDGVYLWLGDGTEYGASWQAAYQILGIREGLERIVQWGFTSDGVKTPKYNVIEMLEKMKGQNRIEMRLIRDNRSTIAQSLQKIDGIASISPDESIINIFVYSHYKYRYRGLTLTDDPQRVQVTIRNIPFTTPKAKVTHWVVDSTHSNFFNQWLEDSKNLPRVSYNGTGGSIYDAGVNSNFNQEGHVFWWNHKPSYLQIDDLEKLGPDTSLAINADGALTVSIGMRPHQVSLLEITPDFETDVHERQQPLLQKYLFFDLYPNPFNSSIVFQIEATNQPVTILIYDITGKFIKSFKTIPKENEKQIIFSWDGKNDTREPVPSGVYVAQLISGNQSLSRKITLLR